jgi:hypothetical protein
MPGSLMIVPRFLRHPSAFFESIRRGENVEAVCRALGLSSVLFLAAFGFVIGLSHSFWQALSSAIKLPLLFLATIVFCLPAFYFFSLVLGTPLKMVQVACVGLAGISVTAFLLLGLAPVMLFFVLTSKSYPFFQLLAVAFVGLSGLVGLYFVWRGMALADPLGDPSQSNLRRLLLSAWFLLYAFVGSQMTWRLSPLVGDPAVPFLLLQSSRDNFYMDVLRAGQRALGLPSSFAFSGELVATLLAGAVCLLPLALLVFGIGFVAGRPKSQASAPPAPVSSPA